MAWFKKEFTEEKWEEQSNKVDLTVILTIWKRDHLEEQITALIDQTRLPKQIWIYQCGEYVDIKRILRKYPFIEVIKSTINLKYFGRHSIAIHAETKYTWILDDDIIPASTWIETCINICDAQNAIVCRSGRIIPPGEYSPGVVRGQDYLDNYFIADSRLVNGLNVCEEDTIVDYGCGSFFFKTEWEKYFWSIWPQTLQNAEDMHLSATCKIRANIPTIVPKQDSPENSGNLRPKYSFDEHASFKRIGFNIERTEVVKYLINEMGWKPILWT
ncbi:MAG: glycosyltransferase [Cyclobacteriaceae bacterium]